MEKAERFKWEREAFTSAHRERGLMSMLWKVENVSGRGCRLRKETGDHLAFQCHALDELRPEGKFKGEGGMRNGKLGWTFGHRGLIG